MKVFNEYAQYYNLLYQDKDYISEVEYIEALLKKYANLVDVHSILDVGCGTGNHDIILAEKGYDVTGIDRSSMMIEVALNRIQNEKLHFYCLDATDFQLPQSFDAIVSLFHVMSYLTSNQSLFSCFKRIYQHLKSRGVFVFDFWYGPAVMHDPPAVRIKRLSNDTTNVIRLAEPKWIPNQNIVEVHYEIIIENIETHQIKTIHEVHPMRYMFLPELKFMLEEIGFKIIQELEWMSLEKGLTENSWNGLIIAQK